MKIFRSLDDIKNIKDTVVALDNFDGIHVGHQELIRRTVKSAKISGIKSAVFTFNNHPKNVIAGKKVVKNIMYHDEKVEMLRNLGINYLFSIDFDYNINHMEAEDFIQNILMDKLKMKELYCGFNYRFGYKAQGDTDLLMKVGRRRGFSLHVMDPVRVKGQIVSSTLIRELIKEGRVDECRLMLGRNYSIGGEVVRGNMIGRTIGFPTSNIMIDENMVTPSNGVYITRCNYNFKQYEGITNVGIKPTIGDNKRVIETHIFDFNHDIYGREIKVEFIKKLRDEMKLPSVDALAEQIQNDCKAAREYHEEEA